MIAAAIVASPAALSSQRSEGAVIERPVREPDAKLPLAEARDPVAYVEPLTGTFYFKKDPSLEFTEWNCDGLFDYRPFKPTR